MRDLRTAAQQALEALRCVDLQSLVPDYGSGHYSVARLDGPQVKSAITAMEAALAEPQEPVKQCMAHGECFGGECIYTTPPQRKPLTKESLLHIYNQLPNWGMDMDRLPQVLEKFARAVEAAHGVKEGT